MPPGRNPQAVQVGKIVGGNQAKEEITGIAEERDIEQVAGRQGADGVYLLHPANRRDRLSTFGPESGQRHAPLCNGEMNQDGLPG
jgi:hypothetical protein